MSTMKVDNSGFYSYAANLLKNQPREPKRGDCKALEYQKIINGDFYLDVNLDDYAPYDYFEQKVERFFAKLNKADMKEKKGFALSDIEDCKGVSRKPLQLAAKQKDQVSMYQNLMLVSGLHEKGALTGDETLRLLNGREDDFADNILVQSDEVDPWLGFEVLDLAKNLPDIDKAKFYNKKAHCVEVEEQGGKTSPKRLPIQDKLSGRLKTAFLLDRDEFFERRPDLIDVNENSTPYSSYARVSFAGLRK